MIVAADLPNWLERWYPDTPICCKPLIIVWDKNKTNVSAKGFPGCQVQWSKQLGVWYLDVGNGTVCGLGTGGPRFKVAKRDYCRP